MKLKQHHFLQQKVTVCRRECPHTEHNFVTFPFLKLVYLTVCSGYTFFNTFIDIARYITFIYQHCQQYYNGTHSIQLDEVGVIQLHGNDPDMAKTEPQQHLQTSPLSLI